MADFNISFLNMIPNEDSQWKTAAKTGVDNDGGKVRLGLNSNAHPELLNTPFYSASVPAAITLSQYYYRLWYWEPLLGDQIKDQAFANKFFDQAVPMGVPAAVMMLQRALGFPVLDQDEKMGPKTLGALNAVINPTTLLVQFETNCISHYKKIILAKPQYKDNLPGWIARVLK